MPSLLTVFHSHVAVLEFFLPDWQDSTQWMFTLSQELWQKTELLELEPPTPTPLALDVAGTCHRFCHIEVAASRLALDLNVTLQRHVVLSAFVLFFKHCGLSLFFSLLRAASLCRSLYLERHLQKLVPHLWGIPRNLNDFCHFKGFIQLMWVFTTKTNIWGSSFRGWKINK